MSPSIVIAGTKGMLAHAVKLQLQQRNLPFTGVDVDTHDLTNPDDARRLFRETRPTLLINCAAFTNVDKCEEVPDLANAVNGHAVGTLAELSKEHGTKLVHISTDFVFDGNATQPYKVTDAPSPLSAYGRSKLLGEQLLRQHNPPGWIVARTAWLYGPNGNCFPQTILNVARAGKPLRVVADQHGCPTFTYDLAEALLNLVDANASGIFHLVNSGQTTWFGFTQAILEEFEVTTDLGPQTSAEYKKIRPNSAHRPAWSVLDNSDYTRVTGKALRPWRDGLRAYKAAVSQ